MYGQIMETIKVTDAKAQFAELLRKVEAGETVAITRHGQTVAHLVPAEDAERAARKAAVERFRELRKKWPKTGVTAEEAYSWRHEGHKY